MIQTITSSAVILSRTESQKEPSHPIYHCRNKWVMHLLDGCMHCAHHIYDRLGHCCRDMDTITPSIFCKPNN